MIARISSNPLARLLTIGVATLLVTACSTLPPGEWPDRVGSEIELSIPGAVGDFPFPESDDRWTIRELVLEPDCGEHRVAGRRRFVIPDGVDHVRILCRSRLLLDGERCSHDSDEAIDRARQDVEARLADLFAEWGDEDPRSIVIEHRLRVLPLPIDTEPRPTP